MTFQTENSVDPRTEGYSRSISACFSGCVRSRNKSGLLGLLQSGRNPNKISSDFDVSIALGNDEEKIKKIEPYLKNGRLPSTSVLHEAIIYNDEDVINILLNFGARINDFCGIDRQGLSCLMLAVILNHNNLLDLLVKRGCNYSMFNPYDERTALDLAIINNNIQAVNYLGPFKRFFYFRNPKRSKLTVCEYVKSYSLPGTRLEMVDQMVTIGYDLGGRPEEAILMLLNEDSDMENGETIKVIQRIANQSHDTLKPEVDTLRERKFGGSIIQQLSRKCHARAIQVLIEAGVDVNEGDDAGDLPLHIAVREPVTAKSIEVIGTLLEAGADLFKRNHKKMSPLDIALEFPQVHSTISKFVSSQAYEISLSNKVHEMLSDLEATLNPRVLQFLWSRKVTFQSLNGNNQTPLHVLLDVHGSSASDDVMMQCINVLLENGSILDIVDVNGMNPAMIALSKNVSSPIVMRLISGPVCTQHISPRGHDILSMIISVYKAKDEEKLSLCQLAVKKGALVNNPSRFGSKSLIAACERANLSSQGVPRFLLSRGFKPLREDIDCVCNWSLSLLEICLEHCNPITIQTQFPNILITIFKTFIPRINDTKSPGVLRLLAVVHKLVHDFHVDVNYSERGKHVLHLLILFKSTHRYPVCPLIKEILCGQNVDLNVGHDCGTGTPLTHALKNGEYSIADTLIKSMTDFSKTNINVMTLKFGFSGIIKTLFKKGVRIDNKFFEKGFGQNDMEIVEEMSWLKNYLKSEGNHREGPDSASQIVKKIKSFRN